jgi:hypothetical protein
VDGRPNARVRPASTNVGHRCVDLVVSRTWSLSQEGYRRHDLSGLAITALRNVKLLPCNLDGMSSVGGQTFNGRNFGADRSHDGQGAGSPGCSIDMDVTGAALANSTRELGAREAYHIPQNPQKRRFRLHVQGMLSTVDLQNEPHIPTPDANELRERDLRVATIS